MDNKTKAMIDEAINDRVAQNIKDIMDSSEDVRSIYVRLRRHFDIKPRHAYDEWDNDGYQMYPEVEAEHNQEKPQRTAHAGSCYQNYYMLLIMELSYKEIPGIRPMLAWQLSTWSRQQIECLYSFSQWMIRGSLSSDLNARHGFFKDEAEFDENDRAQEDIKAQFVKTNWVFVSEVMRAFIDNVQGVEDSQSKQILEAFVKNTAYFEEEWEPNE